MVFKLPNGLSSDQLTSISFENGLDQNSYLISTEFFNWNGNTPATYGNKDGSPVGTAHKWGSDSPGTGATVSFYFDTGSNWTAAEQATFYGAMGLWGDEANVKFTAASSETSATLVFYRYGSNTAPVTLSEGFYEDSDFNLGTLGTQTLGTVSSAYVSAQTQAVGSYGDITSFSTYGGYGVDAIVHEMGHVVGLGHAGPYNGAVNSSTQQLDTTDNRLYSIMSYINPSDTSAKYYNSYTVTGTNWGTTSDGYARAPYTPMQDDILAAQQLYGMSSGTTLNKTQTFGFDTTISVSDPIREFYDFTVDTEPVITIFDSAPDNTLDLSGFSSNSTVNLDPGSFSSAGGLTNNIGIAYDTAIDSAIGGSGNNTFYVNADADTINGGSGGTNTVVFSSNLAAFSLKKSSGEVTVTNLTTSVTDQLQNVAKIQFSDQSILTANLACYAAGTRIATAAGDVAVEALRAGDAVLLAREAATADVIWVGRRRLRASAQPRPEQVWPIRIHAGALGDGVPRHDLRVSPEHAMWVDGALMPARCLMNGTSIVQEQVEEITYYHIELPRHDLLLAEGAPAESWLDTGNRAMFENAPGAILLHPTMHSNAPPIRPASRCAPLVEDGPAVAAARARLAARARDIGFGRADVPEIVIDRLGDWCVTVPAEATMIRLVSESRSPAGERRRLGVVVSDIAIDGVAVPLDDARLGLGFHAVETHDGRSWRWTDGDAALVLGATAATREFTFHVGALAAVLEPARSRA